MAYSTSFRPSLVAFSILVARPDRSQHHAISTSNRCPSYQTFYFESRIYLLTTTFSDHNPFCISHYQSLHLDFDRLQLLYQPPRKLELLEYHCLRICRHLGSFEIEMPPTRTFPPVKAVKTERSHEENQERLVAHVLSVFGSELTRASEHILPPPEEAIEVSKPE